MQQRCSIVLSLVALTLSIVSLFGIHQNIKEIPELVLTLFGVCATVIVGVSLVNTLELLEIGHRLKEIEQIQKKIDETEIKMEEMRNHANVALHISHGLALWSWKPKLSISECLKGLEIAIRMNDCARAKSCLGVLKNLLKKIENDENLKSLFEKENIEELPKEIPDWYKDYAPYKVLKNKLHEVFDIIKKLINI